MTVNGSEEYIYETTLPEIVVTGKKTKKQIGLPPVQVDIDQITSEAVDVLKKNSEKISKEALSELNQLMKMKEDDLVDKYLLETVLKDKIQARIANIFSKLNIKDIKELYKNAKTDEERLALGLLFKEYEVKDTLEKQKLKEINKVIDETQLELKYFQGSVMEQSTYKAENLRASSVVETVSKGAGTNMISDEEMKNLNTFLDGEGVLTEKLTRVERGLKSDFRKLLQIVGERASLKSILGTLQSQVRANVISPDWNKLFPKEENGEYTSKELKNLENGYLAYLESKTSNPDLSRWNHVLNLLET